MEHKNRKLPLDRHRLSKGQVRAAEVVAAILGDGAPWPREARGQPH